MGPRSNPFSPRAQSKPEAVPLGRDAAVGPVSVLAVVDRYPPKVNAGAEWMLHAMLRDSAARGHRVTVATGCTDDPYLLDGVQVVPSATAEAVAAEVVVGHLAWTREAIEAARRRMVPLLYLVHNDQQVRFWRLSRREVSCFVWNSEWIAAAGRPMPEARAVPGTVVRPPLVAADYRVDGSARREFLTIVNPIDAKGSGLFYAMAERFPRRKFLAVEGAYGSQVRPGPRARNVVWQTQTADMRGDVFARTRVMLVPSKYETWGRAAVEALAAGVPVIAHPTDGLVEACGDAALFVDWRDRDGWAAAITDLDDPEVYAARQAAAAARVVELEALAAVDLERWDRVVRLAAGATRVASGAMTTRRYDPFSGRADGPKAPRDRQAEPPAFLGPEGALLDTIRNHQPGHPPVVSVQVSADVNGDGSEWRDLFGVRADDTDDPGGLTDEWIIDVLTDNGDGVGEVAAGDGGFRAVVTFADGSEQTITAPTLPIAQAPQDGSPVPAAAEPDGGPETGTQPGVAPLPEKAADLVALLGVTAEQDPDGARELAERVKAAEDTRDTPRKSVTAAVERILG